MPDTASTGVADFHIRLLGLVAEGLTDAELAQRLHMSESTVRRRLTELGDTLGNRRREAMVSEGYRRGLIETA